MKLIDLAKRPEQSVLLSPAVDPISGRPVRVVLVLRWSPFPKRAVGCLRLTSFAQSEDSQFGNRTELPQNVSVRRGQTHTSALIHKREEAQVAIMQSRRVCVGLEHCAAAVGTFPLSLRASLISGH